MNTKTAIRIMLWLVLAFIIFHLTIIIKIVPYEITWGGRLKNDSEMYMFETISIAINLFLGFILLLKGEFIKQLLPQKVVNAVLWAFLVLFVLNTLGNMVAKTNFEKFFAIITLALSILLWIILNKKKKPRTQNTTYSA